MGMLASPLFTQKREREASAAMFDNFCVSCDVLHILSQILLGVAPSLHDSFLCEFLFFDKLYDEGDVVLRRSKQNQCWSVSQVTSTTRMSQELKLLLREIAGISHCSVDVHWTTL